MCTIYVSKSVSEYYKDAHWYIEQTLRNAIRSGEDDSGNTLKFVLQCADWYECTTGWNANEISLGTNYRFVGYAYTH